MIIIVNKRKTNSERAFGEACKKNGLIYKKYDKAIESSDYVKLADEEGNCFHLNNDLSIKKCSREEDNDLAVAKESALSRSKVKKRLKKNSSYKIQKGLQKA
jgi:hypothetical protein